MRPLKSEIPSSVYRLQLSEEFPLRKATGILAYLKDLGIEALYCSPLYDSYSSHGYDVGNPNELNPVIGTKKDFREFCNQLKRYKLGLILDVVPNHMGIKGGKNIWWQDVLENGPFSEFASFFDIYWSPEKRELQDKVLLPFLGSSFGSTLENQEIRLSFQEGQFLLNYADFPLPVAQHSYAIILETENDKIQDLPEYEEFANLILLYREFPVAIQERRLKKEEGRKKMIQLMERSEAIHHFIYYLIGIFNGKKQIPQSFNLLERLIEAQFYRLSYWRVASHEINYRRFFNINELVAICIEKETVLNEHHKWVFDLVDQEVVQGLRIDHPDGLYDPIIYFERLRNRCPVFTVVEKILDLKEELSDWEVEGTVGYEYLNVLNGLFIEPASESEFTDIYEEFTGRKITFEDTLYHCKKMFTGHQMVSEVEALGYHLDRLSERNRHYRDFTRFELTRALQEVIAAFPVYRTYIRSEGGVSRRDATFIKISVEKARKKASDLDPSLFDFIEKMLLLKLNTDKEEQERYRQFILKFQQLTGPIMAKGMEDTSFYIYNRFISLNEVGGHPPQFGNSIQEFHKFNQRKQEKWPYGLLPTSTHDTKRNEDVRMRLNVLSEIPDEWQIQIKRWSKVNQTKKTGGIPSLNTEYYIYQTLIGIWPSIHFTHKKEQIFFIERVWNCILKSIREASQETSWLYPNREYEECVKNFLYAILTPDNDNAFLKIFIPFQRKISHLGSLNSLSMIALKIASCGVVDIYQGNEILNYKLMDPDNRTTIDFDARKRMLHHVKKTKIDHLLHENIQDFGKIKCFIHWKALNYRRDHHSLFLEGEYIPLKVTGKRKNHVIALMRRFQDQHLIVVASRFFATQDSLGASPHWENTEILLEKHFVNRTWKDLFTDRKIEIRMHKDYAVIVLSDLLNQLPCCYLYGI